MESWGNIIVLYCLVLMTEEHEAQRIYYYMVGSALSLEKVSSR
jgi:hypothetical protein